MRRSLKSFLDFDKVIIPQNVEKYYREPEKLLNTAVSSRHLKINFQDKPLVIFIGGAGDFHYYNHFYQAFLPYLQQHHQDQTIVYATHGATKGIRRLIQTWHKKRQRICLIGHSWGASRLMKTVVRDLPAVEFATIITLDPVSRLTPGKRYAHPGNVQRWINCYVDYPNVSFNYPNFVAILGGYWGHCPGADKNIALSEWEGREVNHISVEAMFKVATTHMTNLCN
jgi:hypothetical protein